MWPSKPSQLLRDLHAERLVGRLPKRAKDHVTPTGTTPPPETPGGTGDAEVIELAFGAQCDTTETIGA